MTHPVDLRMCYNASEDTFSLPADIRERYRPFGFPTPLVPGRPYIASHFVMSLDGKASFANCLVEDELLRLGAIFEKMAQWQPFSIVDGRLVTGQHPASSISAGQALLKLLGESAAHASA